MAYVSSILLTLTVVIKAVNSWDSCLASDCVQHVTDFAYCDTYEAEKTSDCRWRANMDGRLDEIIYGGRIIAYWIQWFNGSWSDVYVPGQNDLDYKFNMYDYGCAIPYRAKSLRRIWNYFFDHTHLYIMCN